MGQSVMAKTIHEHEGKKYLRQIRAVSSDSSCAVDVYAVIEAFGVTCPARAHAIKKLLCCGNRNKGSEMADLLGAEAAISRAIELQRNRDLGLCDTIKTTIVVVPNDHTSINHDLKECP